MKFKFRDTACEENLPKNCNALKPGITHPIRKCTACRQTFTKISELELHQKFGSCKEKWKCKVCDTEFTNQARLASHSSIHENTPKFKCETCENAFSSKVELMSHASVHDTTFAEASDREISHLLATENAAMTLEKQNENIIQHIQSHLKGENQLTDNIEKQPLIPEIREKSLTLTHDEIPIDKISEKLLSPVNDERALTDEYTEKLLTHFTNEAALLHENVERLLTHDTDEETLSGKETPPGEISEKSLSPVSDGRAPTNGNVEKLLTHVTHEAALLDNSIEKLLTHESAQKSPTVKTEAAAESSWTITEENDDALLTDVTRKKFQCDICGKLYFEKQSLALHMDSHDNASKVEWDIDQNNYKHGLNQQNSSIKDGVLPPDIRSLQGPPTPGTDLPHLQIINLTNPPTSFSSHAYSFIVRNSGKTQSLTKGTLIPTHTDAITKTRAPELRAADHAYACIDSIAPIITSLVEKNRTATAHFCPQHTEVTRSPKTGSAFTPSVCKSTGVPKSSAKDSLFHNYIEEKMKKALSTKQSPSLSHNLNLASSRNGFIHVASNHSKNSNTIFLSENSSIVATQQSSLFNKNTTSNKSNLCVKTNPVLRSGTCVESSGATKNQCGCCQITFIKNQCACCRITFNNSEELMSHLKLGCRFMLPTWDSKQSSVKSSKLNGKNKESHNLHATGHKFERQSRPAGKGHKDTSLIDDSGSQKPAQFICIDCDLVFSSANELAYHKWLHNSVECVACGLICKNKKGYDRHIKYCKRYLMIDRENGRQSSVTYAGDELTQFGSAEIPKNIQESARSVKKRIKKSSMVKSNLNGHISAVNHTQSSSNLDEKQWEVLVQMDTEDPNYSNISSLENLFKIDKVEDTPLVGVSVTLEVFEDPISLLSTLSPRACRRPKGRPRKCDGKLPEKPKCTVRRSDVKAPRKKRRSRKVTGELQEKLECAPDKSNAKQQKKKGRRRKLMGEPKQKLECVPPELDAEQQHSKQELLENFDGNILQKTKCIPLESDPKQPRKKRERRRKFKGEPQQKLECVPPKVDADQQHNKQEMPGEFDGYVLQKTNCIPLETDPKQPRKKRGRRRKFNGEPQQELKCSPRVDAEQQRKKQEMPGNFDGNILQKMQWIPPESDSKQPRKKRGRRRKSMGERKQKLECVPPKVDADQQHKEQEMPGKFDGNILQKTKCIPPESHQKQPQKKRGRRRKFNGEPQQKLECTPPRVDAEQQHEKQETSGKLETTLQKPECISLESSAKQPQKKIDMEDIDWKQQQKPKYTLVKFDEKQPQKRGGRRRKFDTHTSAESDERQLPATKKRKRAKSKN